MVRKIHGKKLVVLEKDTGPVTHQTSIIPGLAALAQSSGRRASATSKNWVQKDPIPPVYERTMTNVNLGEAYEWLRQSVVPSTKLCINSKEA